LKKASTKKIVGTVLFLLINIAVILLLIFFERKGGAGLGREAFSRLVTNLPYTFLSFSTFFIIVLCDVAVFIVLLKNISNIHGTRCLKLSLAVSVLGRYYDRITPWATGGEPFQIGLLISGGVPAGDSAAVTVARHIVRSFAIAPAVIIIIAASRVASNVYVMVAAVISVFGGLIIPIFMLICVYRPAVGQKIGRGVIKLLYKLRIVKNYDKQVENMQRHVSQFIDGLKLLAEHKKTIALICIAAIIELFANGAAPYFVMRALGHSEDFWRVFVLCLFVNYAASFAPTPGGAGIAELSFYAVFSAAFNDGFLFWAVLFWRVCVFYTPIFIGFVTQTAYSVRRIRGHIRKNKDERQLTTDN